LDDNSKGLNQQDISNSLWALATMGISWVNLPENLRAALLKSLHGNSKNLNQQDISNSLWALAVMGISWVNLDENLQTALLKSLHDNSKNLNQQGISNSLWALGCMNIPKEIFPKKLFSNITASSTFSLKHITQISQLGLLGYDIPRDKFLPKDFVFEQKSDSDLERVIFQHIQSLLKDALDKNMCQVSNNDILFGFMMPDITIKNLRTNDFWVIEVDGPSHFYKNGEYNANTNMRNRIYETQKVQYTTIKIPGVFHEIQEIIEIIEKTLNELEFFKELLKNEHTDKSAAPVKRKCSLSSNDEKEDVIEVTQSSQGHDVLLFSSSSLFAKKQELTGPTESSEKSKRRCRGF